MTAHPHFPLEIFALNEDSDAQLNIITDNLYEESTTPTFEQASKRFGPVNILIVNASITDESTEYPGQDMSLDTWEDCLVNVRGSLLTIKHFLQTTKESQDLHGRELDNLSIVLTGRKQKEHTLAKPANAALQFGLVTAVNNDIVRINSNARINLITFDCSNNSYSQMTRPGLVARSIAFLASHRAAGHISGQAVSFDEHREGFLVWKQNKVLKTAAVAPGSHTDDVFVQAIPISLPKPKGNKIRIAVSVDLDAVSGWLGTGKVICPYNDQELINQTGKHSDNILADYSSGIFAAKVGVPRLLRMLKKLDLANRCTWFIPGHSAESFPEEVREVVNSGCEIGLHGYAHEGAYQLTIEQERDVLTKCIDFATRLSGKRPVGYRAPLYQLRESTLDLLEEFGFEYGGLICAFLLPNINLPQMPRSPITTVIPSLLLGDVPSSPLTSPVQHQAGCTLWNNQIQTGVR